MPPPRRASRAATRRRNSQRAAGLVSVLVLFLGVGRLHSENSNFELGQIQLLQNALSSIEAKATTATATATITTKVINPARPVEKVHVVFSTSCSVSQDWQSYLFFFHAMLHKQPGVVTRIVSGCKTSDDEAEMKRLHQERIAIMNPNFRLHFTPEFGKVKGRSWETTKYWNKPFGMRHWLQHNFGFAYEKSNINPLNRTLPATPFDDHMVVLLDPDMLIQRPFVNDFSNFPNSTWIKFVREHPEDMYHKVTQGKPMGQTYSFGAAWLSAGQKNLTHVVGLDSPVHQVGKADAIRFYSVGPPYILTARDMYKVVFDWARFLPPLSELFPGFMMEMYAYCFAAAHLQLKHQVARGFMVSNVQMQGNEGWEFMEERNTEQLENSCDLEQYEGLAGLPQVIHFCQRYGVGEFFINKHLMPNILECNHPLMELPPNDIAKRVNYSHYGDGTYEVWEGHKVMQKYRNTYMICSILSTMNSALTFLKDHNCPNGANYNRTWNHHKSTKAAR